MDRKDLLLKIFGCGSQLYIQGEEKWRLKDVSKALGLVNWVVDGGAIKIWEAQRGR